MPRPAISLPLFEMVKAASYSNNRTYGQFLSNGRYRTVRSVRLLTFSALTLARGDAILRIRPLFSSNIPDMARTESDLKRPTRDSI